MSATDRLLRWLSWLLLVAGAALSVWLNAVHARRVGDTVGFHVAIPVLVLGFGVYAELIFLSPYPRAVRWLTGMAVTAGFMFAIATSYVSILSVVRVDMRSSPAWVQTGTAGLPDVVMLIAVTVLLAHRWRVSRDVQSPSSERPASAFARLRDAAVARAEAALAVPDTVTERPVTDRVTVPVTDRLTDVRTVSERPATDVHSPYARPMPVPDVTDRHLTEARELVKRTGKRTPAEQVAAVLRGLDADNTIAAISAELGMAERTIREIRDARRPHLVGRVV